jgi:CubicO group peptidase (beta-lactamase class C family)
MSSAEEYTAKLNNILTLDFNILPHMPQIDKFLNKYLYSLGGYLPEPANRRKVPGAAVIVRKGNELVHLNCYGYANIEEEKKITPATIFDLGSLSKQFTALAAISVFGSDLSVHISDFLPGLPRYADKITIDDLIHHTSALPEYVEIYVASRQAEEDWYDVAMATRDDWYPQMQTRKAKEISNKDVLRWVASQKLLPRAPDTEFEYSNTGYVVLAQLVERVTKQRLRKFLKYLVFEHAKMHSTYVFDETCAFGKDAPEVAYHAKCYNRVNGKGFVPVGYTPLNFIYGDGNVHSTIVDMAKYEATLALSDYLAISDSGGEQPIDVQALLWSPIRVRHGKRVDYGAGWNLIHDTYEDEVEKNGRQVTKKFESRAEYHRGLWLGWRSYIARAARWVVPESSEAIDPDTFESLGIIVLSNNNQFNTCRVAQHIARLFWGNFKKDNLLNRFNCD